MPVAHQMTTTQFELDGYQIMRIMGVVREYSGFICVHQSNQCHLSRLAVDQW